MDLLLITCLLLSFLFTFFAILLWINRAKKAGLTGIDMHKKNKKRVAEIGGIPVLFGFIFGTMLYTGYRTFINNATDFNTEILGVTATICVIGIIGIMDDILGWKLGLRQYQKPILCLFAALPLVMTMVGNSKIMIPYIGIVDIGIIYYVIIIPIAISGAANAFNMIAGYNGLEAGMGIIILSTLGLVIWLDQGLGNVAMLAGIMVACLSAFLLFNSYPSMIFPGDSLTYTIGALIAAVSILGNTEKIALFLFIPYFLQFFLKSLGGWRKESFSGLDQKGNLHVPHNRCYGVEHLVVKIKGYFGKVSENDVVFSIYSIELVLVLIVLLNSSIFWGF